MASEPEVIIHQMEETRSDLAEKLDTLEKEVVDTVHEATEAVSGTVENVKDAVQETVATVKGTVQDTVESIRETFDLKCQVQRHPWAMLGGSVAVGYFLGSMVNRLTTSGTTEMPMSKLATRSDGRQREVAARETSEASALAGATSAIAGAASSIFEALGPEIERLKGLAIGTALGAVRDTVAEALPPAIKGSVCDVLNRVTSKLGGEPVHDTFSSRSQTERQKTRVSTEF